MFALLSFVPGKVWLYGAFAAAALAVGWYVQHVIGEAATLRERNELLRQEIATQQEIAEIRRRAAQVAEEARIEWERKAKRYDELRRNALRGAAEDGPVAPVLRDALDGLRQPAGHQDGHTAP